MKKFTDIFDKNYLIKVCTTLMTATFALGAIFYISYHIADRFEEDLSLLDAEEKTVVKNILADAYVFRDEIVLHTSGFYDGSVTPAVADGEKIAIHERVADVYNYTSPDVEKRIAEIDRQILLLEQSRSENVSVQNTAGLDSEIYKNIDAIRTKSENGAYGEALAYRAELLVSIKKKEILTGAIENPDEEIRLLLDERAELTARLGTRLESVESSAAGYFYSKVDGYERIFTTEALEGLNYDGFMQLTEAEAEPISSSAAGKIAVDFRWYIACPMTKADSAYFEEGVSYSVVFPYNTTTLKVKLYSVIGEPGGSDAVVVFECRTLPENFEYLRVQPVQISATNYIGFEIPVTAIRMVDGYEGVYVLDEVTVEFRRVTILYEYDEYFLCVGNTVQPDDSEEEEKYSWIKRNDIIITEGKDLEVGKVIG